MQHYINRAKELFKKLTVSNIYERIRYDQAVVLTYQYLENETANPNSNIQIENVTNNNIEDALIYEPQLKVDAFSQFLIEGDCGFYAYSKGQFIHRSWVTFGPKIEPQWKRYVQLELKKEEAFIHWCETVPWARGTGVYPSVLKHIVSALADRATEFYISTTDDNVASRKGIEKAGFSLISGCEVKSLLGFGTEKLLRKETLSEYQL